MVVGALGGAAAEATFGQLITAVDALKNTMRESMAFADNAQKASLALGQTFQDTNTSLGGTIEGLRGDMNERFAAAVAGMEAGLQGNTAGIARLVNQQRLTGTQSANTAKAFAGMEAALGLSREQTNNLASTLIQTGAEYQISTDNLVGALDALKASFPAQALAGMGDKVQGAMVQLQAELGPQMAGPLSNVMKMVMDTSMEGYEKLTMLGIGDVRERLSAAQSATEAQEILKQAMVTASDNFKGVAGDASEGFHQIGIATELFGQNAIDFTTVTANFGVRVKKENAEADKFAQTLSTLRSEILQPFAQAMEENIFPIFQRVVIGIAQWLRIALNTLDPAIKWVTDMFNKLGDLFEDQSSVIAWAVHLGITTPFNLVKIAISVFINGLDSIYLAFLGVVKGLAKAIDEIPFTDMGDTIKGVSKEMGKVTDRITDRVKDQMDLAGNIFRDPKEALKELMDDDDPNKAGNRLMNGIIEGLERNFQMNTETAKNTKAIDDKTPDLIVTQPKFLDETAAMLGESIEGILGVGRDTTAEDMLEELRVANAQRAAQGVTGSPNVPTDTEAL